MQKLDIKKLYSVYQETKSVDGISNKNTKAFLLSLFGLLDFEKGSCTVNLNSLLLSYKIQLSNLDSEHIMLPVTDLSHLLEHIALLVNGYPNIFKFNPDASSLLFVDQELNQHESSIT